ARREVVEAHGGVDAAGADRRQPFRQDRVGGNRAGQRLVVVVVVAQPELERGAAVRQRVLHVGRDVGQLVDRVAVARQVGRAPAGDVIGVGGRQRGAVVAHTGWKTRGGVATGHADGPRVVVAPVTANLESVISPQL